MKYKVTYYLCNDSFLYGKQRRKITNWIEADSKAESIHLIKSRAPLGASEFKASKVQFKPRDTETFIVAGDQCESLGLERTRKNIERLYNNLVTRVQDR
jgi:methylase of polypeptide subunit release factors